MMFEFSRRGIALSLLSPLLDDQVPSCRVSEQSNEVIRWILDDGGVISAAIDESDGVTSVSVSVAGVDKSPISLGLRFAAKGVLRYLRNGYHSWDGSYFAEPGTPAGDGPPEKAPTLGFAMTSLVSQSGAIVLGFDRHDRFQTCLHFGGDSQEMIINVVTQLDATGVGQGETLRLFDDPDVESSLRRWSKMCAKASPLAPRIPSKRITGWCSWYNLYAAITEENLLKHLEGARRFRDTHAAPLDIFLIDDGFTPEMGDWLDVKPQFPRGMPPLLSDIRAAGFTPGLWIAPFMVGNQSKLYAEHPDWVVQDRNTGGPLVQMHFYGEFRWHKRSEEYYILDITHPEAEAYIRQVFKTWTNEWGAGYFKTDFMFFGAEHGPDRAMWHQPGLSRIEIWRRMAGVIRAEIGEALWLGCGFPLWAATGLVDAVRIGRDVGVKWSGEQSAESLLRGQTTRNHASGILWQADPDCILLRDRYHELTDQQVHALALFAGLAGGVFMTSDSLDTLSDERARLFERLASLDIIRCSYPDLGKNGPMIRQLTKLRDGSILTLLLDPQTGASTCIDGDGNPWPETI
jgi:alpha-galactosidase